MKRLFKELLLSLLIGSCSLTFSSCFGFGDEAMEISSITTVTLENGDIQVIITYVDEDTKPTTFVVPKGDSGEDGKDGNGIKEITSSQSEDGLNTLVNITFTQNNVDPIEVKVPNGVSIVNMECPYNEEKGMCELTVYFSDGNTFGPIEVPKGEKGDKGDKGEDGNSILEIIPEYNDDKTITLTITQSKEPPVIVTIPAPKEGEDGKDGKEVVDISADFDGDKYLVTVTYNDESQITKEFDRPNRWFSELSSPTKEDGINGDLWYDIERQIIYIKQNNRWIPTIDFNDVIVDSYTIEFDLNDNNGIQANMPSGTLISYEIEKNSNFYSSGYSVPEPTREGYEFVGWYTVRNASSVNGIFTDLTPVSSNMTLYANWKAIEGYEPEIPSEETTEDQLEEPTNEPSLDEN